jgi:hypothetical protein
MAEEEEEADEGDEGEEEVADEGEEAGQEAMTIGRKVLSRGTAREGDSDGWQCLAGDQRVLGARGCRPIILVWYLAHIILVLLTT